jgi:hypothetical protein
VGFALFWSGKGWRDVNIDLRPGRNGLAVCADAHSLPFRDGAFAMIVANCSSRSGPNLVLSLAHI